MERIINNPEDYKDKYISHLNESFGTWGGEREYEWAFNRKIGNHPSDIILIEDDEVGVMAGSANTYRKLSKDGNETEIGIIIGTWTLPFARRKGCFGKIVNESIELCKRKNIPLITAFVIETNPSGKGLRSQGFYMHPTQHLFSPEKAFDGTDVSQVEVLEHSEKVYKSLFQNLQAWQSQFLHFSYSYDEFVGQYLDRIKQPTILKLGGNYAIVEDGRNETKILLHTYQDEASIETNMKQLTNWCLSEKSNKAFFYSTRPEVTKIAKDLGFEVQQGFFPVLNVHNEEMDYADFFGSLNINMADKM